MTNLIETCDMLILEVVFNTLMLNTIIHSNYNTTSFSYKERQRCMKLPNFIFNYYFLT